MTSPNGPSYESRLIVRLLLHGGLVACAPLVIRSGKERSLIFCVSAVNTAIIEIAMQFRQHGHGKMELAHIPSSGIFRVGVANWLRACVSLGRTRNIKREACNRERRRRVVGLESSHREVRYFRFVPTPVLDFRTRRDTNARSLEALGFWANDNLLLLLPPS
jgi:hypothetical protein